MTGSVTAAILVIGDEILSGRTKDANIGHIAERCNEVGIDVREVRIVADEQAAIVAAVNVLRHRYTHVFTTGGIGPTHDDITADAIAAAFDVGISEDPRAVALLLQRIEVDDLNEARRRMARIPHGAELVANPISKAPGFHIGNVVVMAGVPAIMRAMLDDVLPRLAAGAKTISRATSAGELAEGTYAGALARIAAAHPDVSIGSYPSFADGRFRNEIIARGKNVAEVDEVTRAIADMLDALRNQPQ